MLDIRIAWNIMFAFTQDNILIIMAKSDPA